MRRSSQGSVGGIDTLLVLDTGSDVHILTKELVDELGLDVEEGEEGVDHSGATMPSWSVADAPSRSATRSSCSARSCRSRRPRRSRRRGSAGS